MSFLDQVGQALALVSARGCVLKTGKRKVKQTFKKVDRTACWGRLRLCSLLGSQRKKEWKQEKEIFVFLPSFVVLFVCSWFEKLLQKTVLFCSSC